MYLLAVRSGGDFAMKKNNKFNFVRKIDDTYNYFLHYLINPYQFDDNQEAYLL